jgi:hypothetical protein
MIKFDVKVKMTNILGWREYNVINHGFYSCIYMWNIATASNIKK